MIKEYTIPELRIYFFRKELIRVTGSSYTQTMLDWQKEDSDRVLGRVNYDAVRSIVDFDF